MNFILSPCGTSILTNEAKDSIEKDIVSKHANTKEESKIFPEDREKLNNIIRRAEAKLQKSDMSTAIKFSAELNGIITFYGENMQTAPRQDFHLLIATDTYLGKTTALMIEEWLEKNYSVAVCTWKVENLQTNNYSDFKAALTSLVQKLHEDHIKPYRDKNYRIIFNLTGGFKSVQGFLQAIGMLFGVDEIIYIFEKSQTLMRIPKLPLEINMDIFKDEDNLDFFRKLDMGLAVNLQKADKIPDALVEEAGGIYDFSAWGKALWMQEKTELYKKKILPPPTEKIKFGPKFQESCNQYKYNAAKIAVINEKIDQLALFLEKKLNPRSLDFKPLRDKTASPLIHEMDAWHDGDAKRIYGHYENNIFILDKLDKALH